MAVERTIQGGRPGYRWGKSGKVFFYTVGDAASREQAKKKAAAQGTAKRKKRR